MKVKLWNDKMDTPSKQYLPKLLSEEADICINNCPNRKCNGTCEFYKAEVAKLRKKYNTLQGA